jgi:hypothetical protein
MKKAYSPGKPSELKIINILKNNKDLKHGTSLSKYISSKTTNRNNNAKYNLKERPASHKTINSLISKKTKPLIQKQQYQHQPISVKNNNNEINIHLSFGSDSINNNTNSYLNNTNYSKVTNSYEDILKEKDMVILKLEKELLLNRELINKIQSNYNIYNNNYTNNNNFISLSKTKSSGNITTKRKNKHDTQYFFSSLFKNISKKNKKKKMSYGDINTNNINNGNGMHHVSGNRLTNIIYSSTNKDNIVKGNYNNYHSNLNLKSKKKKKKTNSCEMNDKIKCIENLLSSHKNNKDKSSNKDKNKKIQISLDNWKLLCDNIYSKTKNTLEKCKEALNSQLINN